MKVERMNEKILNSMDEERYVSAKELSLKLHSTEKTIRNHIYNLNDFLKKNGAHIQIKHGSGYRLFVDDNEVLSNVYRNGKIIDLDETPATPEDRVDYIICYLLMQTSYVDLLDLCEVLCISEATLIMDIRNAKVILSKFQLKLSNVRKKGTKIIGTEFHIRLCMANYLETSKMLYKQCRNQITQDKVKISKEVLALFSKHHVSMPEVSLEKLINHIYISVRRIQNGCEIIEFKSEVLIDENSEIKKITLNLCEKLSTIFHVSFRQEESTYIMLYMIGQRLNNHKEIENNIQLSNNHIHLVHEILDFIYKTMNLDFRNHFSLIMDLSVHMMPLIIRLNYHILVDNPLLQEIKENYSLSYTIALQASIVIEKYHGKKLSENEVGYLALIFEVSMKRNTHKQTSKKKNIVIVCATGKTSAELLAYQYQKMFSEYLNEIHVCNIHELSSFNFTDIDYVFTTTPIHISIPVPIFNTKFILSFEDVIDIHKKFEAGSNDWIKNFYRRDLFFTHVSLDKKEEILNFMVEEIAKTEDLPKNFYESLMKRESIGFTDFGEFIALPHPYGRVSKTTFASVCVLEKPVFWGNHEISIVILLSVSDNKQGDLDKFYKITSEFMLSHTKAKQFLKNPTYENLITYLNER